MPPLPQRLVAKPGESTYCKLSAMRSALADIAPSHPGYITAATRPVRSLRSPDAASVASAASEPAFPSVPLRAASAPADILLSPDPELYYPAYKARAAAHGAERPGMMGITLVPKKESLVHTDNKDAWEYVMRKLFVMQNQAIGMSIKWVAVPGGRASALVLMRGDRNLGPGAENLLPQLIDDALPPAERLDPKKRVREFDSEDWARIVRVFMGWRFKPEVSARGRRISLASDGGVRRLLHSWTIMTGGSITSRATWGCRCEWDQGADLSPARGRAGKRIVGRTQPTGSSDASDCPADSGRSRPMARSSRDNPPSLPGAARALGRRAQLEPVKRGRSPAPLV